MPFEFVWRDKLLPRTSSIFWSIPKWPFPVWRTLRQTHCGAASGQAFAEFFKVTIGPEWLGICVAWHLHEDTNYGVASSQKSLIAPKESMYLTPYALVWSDTHTHSQTYHMRLQADKTEHKRLHFIPTSFNLNRNTENKSRFHIVA